MMFSLSKGLLLGPLIPTVLSVPTEKTIFVIRHGDKSYNYNDADQAISSQTLACLSQMGWARAYNLVSLFGSASGTRFPSPDVIFSAQYDADIPGFLEENFPSLTPEEIEGIIGIIRSLGIRGNCRDENGWYRTQQTVSAVAQDLGLEVNNSTGFLPRFCSGVEVPYGPGSCIPYISRGPNVTGDILDNPYGTCCNPWSARQMMDELEKPDVNSILVAWEHKNIQFLSRGLADFPQGNDEAIEQVQSQILTIGENGKIIDNWGDDDYDTIYKFTYLCEDGTCSFESLDNLLNQTFNYLGPKIGCGFTVPDDFGEEPGETPEYVEDVFVTEECIPGSSCPVCPLTGKDKNQGQDPPPKFDTPDEICVQIPNKKLCKKVGCNWNASAKNGGEQSCVGKGSSISNKVGIEEGVTVAREQSNTGVVSFNQAFVWTIFGYMFFWV